MENYTSSEVQTVMKALEEMGLDYYYDCSGLSNSEYLMVSIEDPETLGPVDGSESKIRFANHEAKPTYEAMHGEADYEVQKGQGHNMGMGNHWAAIAWLAKRYNKSIPNWATADKVAERKASALKGAETRAAKKHDAFDILFATVQKAIAHLPGRLMPGYEIVKMFGCSKSDARSIREWLQNERNAAKS